MLDPKTSAACWPFVRKISTSNSSVNATMVYLPRKYNRGKNRDRCPSLLKESSSRPSFTKTITDQPSINLPQQKRKNRVKNKMDSKTSMDISSSLLKLSSFSPFSVKEKNMLDPKISEADWPSRKSSSNKSRALGTQDPNPTSRLSRWWSLLKLPASDLSPTQQIHDEGEIKTNSSSSARAPIFPITNEMMKQLPKLEELNHPKTTSACDALFDEKYIKIGHNKRVRPHKDPEISYISNDKMCWRKTDRLQQPYKRIFTHHASAELSDTYNAHHQILPRVSHLECHIFGLLKGTFRKQFKELCEIIGVADFDFTIVPDEGDSNTKVIRLGNTIERRNLLAAVKRYERENGPLSQRLLSGRSKRRIVLLPGPIKIAGSTSEMPTKTKKGLNCLLSPNSWLAVLNQRPFPMDNSECRDYGNIIHASKVLCHVF